MKKMRHLLPFLLLAVHLNAQEFPADYTGTYLGPMSVSSLDGRTDTLEVRFELHALIPDSSWTWHMTYESDRYGTIVKDYLLKTAHKGQYRDFILDEQNGVQMEMTWLNDCLYGMYEVDATNYIVTLRTFNQDLLFDLFTAPTNHPLITGTTSEGREVQVKSYKPTSQQTVHLWREE